MSTIKSGFHNKLTSSSVVAIVRAPSYSLHPPPPPPPRLPHQPPELLVEEEEWYYGDIEREVGENKCKNNGDYIVRYSKGISQFTLICKWNGAPKHFVILETTDVSIELLIELLVWPNEVGPWFITLTCVYTTANLGFMRASM